MKPQPDQQQAGKHTPGPWVIEQPPKFDKMRIAVIHSNGNDIDGNSVNSAVAIVSVSRDFNARNKPSKKEQSNACLISAAPELLAACKTLLAIIHNQVACIDSKYNNGLVAAGKAIAKAEGK